MADFGLKRHAFKAHRRWAVDNLDYARTLPPAEREWLEKFNREFYDGDFRGAEPLHATDDLRRACYSAQNAAFRDVYSRGAVRIEEDAWLERQINSTMNTRTNWSVEDGSVTHTSLGDQLSFRF